MSIDEWSKVKKFTIHDKTIATIGKIFTASKLTKEQYESIGLLINEVSNSRFHEGYTRGLMDSKLMTNLDDIIKERVKLQEL